MKRAIAVARDNQGYLHWIIGMYWAGSNQMPKAKKLHHNCFYTYTIEALVDRGLAEYTGWARYKRYYTGIRELPIEIELTELASKIVLCE